MAGDIRDQPKSPTPPGPSPGENAPPSHITSGTPKVYEVFSAPLSANALPEGSGQNTAGAKQSAPKIGDVVKTVKLEDFKKVYTYPCVRESLLMGIGGGFGMGGVRALWGAPVPKAANWAVGTFIFAAAANYEFCLYRTRLEKAHMKRAVEIIDRKRAEKEAAAKEKRDARRKAKEEADMLAEEAKKKSWKLW